MRNYDFVILRGLCLGSPYEVDPPEISRGARTRSASSVLHLRNR